MDRAHAAAASILDHYARETGLTSSAPPRRYLWTDAHAVCTWVGLEAREGGGRYLELADRLIHQVHHVLGRYRDDDPRSGWISGLPEAEGKAHPTAGGLRIGKPLPERGPGEPYDADAEWDRDGQYYHYLTRWMHALDRMARFTGEPTFQRWGAELASKAYHAFRGAAGGAPRLVWKMSVDLSRALVSSSGHHDALDGLVTAELLRTSPARAPDAPSLDDEVVGLAAMCRRQSWATDDALGIGGLLGDVLGLSRVVAAGVEEHGELLDRTVRDAAVSLEAFTRRSPLGLPADQRLAFRELGLALGLHAAERLGGTLASYATLARELEAFWLDPGNQAAPTWTGHRDINAVTLAASLAPEGCVDG